MKLSIGVRNIIFWLTCLLSIAGAAGNIPYLHSIDSIALWCDIGILVFNICLIAFTLFDFPRFSQTLIFTLDFLAFCYVFATIKDGDSSVFPAFLILGGSASWLLFMGIKRLLVILAVPFRFVFCKNKGIIAGTKWICDCKRGNSDKICGYETITFKNSRPYPFMDKCIWYEHGKHHYVIKAQNTGNLTNLEEMGGHLIATIGFLIAFIGGIITLIHKLF